MPNQFRRKTGQSAVTDRGYIIYCGRRPRRRSIRCSIRLALATRCAWLLLVWLALPLAGAVANNLCVTNTRVIAGSGGQAKVQFDIAWENSWRFTNINQDAAWVFFKAQVEGAEEMGWSHVTLSGTGTNPAGYATGTGGAGIELIVPGDRKGLFLQRSATNEGAGSIMVSNVTAVWSLTDSGISPSSRVRMQTLAIEMVSVPQGAFWAGNTNVVIANSFRAQSSANTPFYILSEDATTIYWGTSPSSAVLTADFPKGFRAFYCMKYEISQGQYADFLNRLTINQAGNRAYTGGGGRYTISGSWPNYTATARDRACNFLNWADGAAYADWAALRPMTELEFEKACRGPMNAVDGEYPWGTASIVQQTGHDTTDGPDGSGRERASPAGANCNYGNVMGGPVRVGIYATTNSTRQGAGASYWGIMELSGNLYERPVTVGHATGLLFTGAHGDGALDAVGYAIVLGWPGTDGTGAGLRGGGYTDVSSLEHVADRSRVTVVDSSNRYNDRGWRGVRSAP